MKKDRKELKIALDNILEKYNYNGAACVYWRGHKVYEGARGFADFEKQIPVTPDTTFFMASVSKQFTGVCAMMMVERGLLDLDAKLSVYLPEYSHASEITVRQALNMQGGIPDYMNDIIDPARSKTENDGSRSEKDFFIWMWDSCSENFTLEDILGYVNELPLRFEPGSKMEYSNTGYYFIGKIVERLSGMSLGDFMRENLFLPLGMTRTHVGGVPADAICYDDFKDEMVALGTCRNTSGDACVITNVRELSLWLQGVMAGKLLKKESWKEVFKLGKFNYGFGYRSMDGWFYHNGGLKTYRTGTYLHMKKRLTIAIMASTENYDKGREDEYCIERAIRRTVEDFYTLKPGSVKLEKVNKDNLDECLSLALSAEQKGFVTDTAELIAEAYTDSTLKPYAVRDVGRYVGFVCLSVDKKEKKFRIRSFLVPTRLQNIGYGKAILGLAVKELKKAGATEIGASVRRRNEIGKAVLLAYGFEEKEHREFIYTV